MSKITNVTRDACCDACARTPACAVFAWGWYTNVLLSFCVSGHYARDMRISKLVLSLPEVLIVP